MTTDTAATSATNDTQTESEGSPDESSTAPTDRYLELAEAEIRADPELMTMEQEVTMRFARDEEVVTFTTHIPSVTRDILRHPEFTIEWVQVLRENGKAEEIPPDSYEESGDPIVGVKGKVPIGALKVKANSRSKNWPTKVVSTDGGR